MDEKQESTEEAKQSNRFAMTEEDDLLAEDEAEHEHVHVPGCCSCHSNIGK